MKIIKYYLCIGTLMTLSACHVPHAYEIPSRAELKQACGLKKHADEVLLDVPYRQFMVHDSTLKKGQAMMSLSQFEQNLQEEKLQDVVQSMGMAGFYTLHHVKDLLVGLSLDQNHQGDIHHLTLEMLISVSEFKQHTEHHETILSVFHLLGAKDIEQKQLDELFMAYEQAIQNKKYDSNPGIVSVTVRIAEWQLNLTASQAEFVEQAIASGKVKKSVDYDRREYRIFQPNLFLGLRKL